MFNFNLNWLKIIKENLPLHLHSSLLFDWIKVLMAPINKIYTEFKLAYDLFVLKIRYNGQIIYLEEILNSKFSPITGGIYITDASLLPKYYLYNKIEGKAPRYLYMNWQSTITYTINKYAVHQNKVWKSLTTNIGSTPSSVSTDWVFHKDIEFLRTTAEFAIDYNFIVMVPSSLVFNITEMRAIIDYYRLAGKRFKIIMY